MSFNVMLTVDICIYDGVCVWANMQIYYFVVVMVVVVATFQNAEI